MKKFSKIHLPKFNLKKIAKGILWFLGGLVCFYLLLGFMVLPVGLRWALQKKVPEIVNHPIKCKKVRFNPLTLRLRIGDLEILDPETKNQMIAFDRFSVDVSSLALLKKTIRVESVELAGLYVNPILSKEGTLNLLSLIPEPQIEKGSSIKEDEEDFEASQGIKENTTEEEALPLIMMDRFRLVNAGILLEDQSLAHPFKYTLRPINIEVTDFSTSINDLTDFMVVFFVGEEGRVIIDGNVNISPFKISLKIASKDIDLSAAQSYLDPFLNIKIDSGDLGFSGELAFNATPDAKESLQYQGNFFLWNLKVVDPEERKTLLGFNSLNLSPIDFLLDQKKVSLGALTLDGLESQIALSSSGTNLDNIVKNSTEDQKIPESKNEDVASKSLPETTDEVSTVEHEKKLGEPNQEDFQFSLNEIHLTNGRIQLKDTTVNPPFETILKDMDIKLTGISTQKDCQVDLDFKGNFNDKGTLETKGNMKPFSEQLDVNLAVRLNNYIMDVLTPYVGKFTGLAVDQGKLNLNIDYTIAKNAINANHKLTINKFEFGQKVESEDALKLPFKLAVSLLKDMSGKIYLTLPVEGSLDDPEFRYMHMVGKVFSNFILKIVTKPFSFLASIAGGEGGEEELSYVQFYPGEDQLRAEEKEKIVKLAKAFNERPLLALEIHGVYDEESDWWAIKTEAYKKQYQARRKESTRSDEKVLEAFYNKRFGHWMYRDVYKKYGSRTKKSNPSQLMSDFHLELKRQLIEDAPADKAVLSQLAQKRAESVKRVFQEFGVNKERIRIGTNIISQSASDAIPMEFSLVVKE